MAAQKAWVVAQVKQFCAAGTPAPIQALQSRKACIWSPTQTICCSSSDIEVQHAWHRQVPLSEREPIVQVHIAIILV